MDFSFWNDCTEDITKLGENNTMNQSLSTVNPSPENGIFIPLEPIAHFDEAEYLKLAQKTIEHYQSHSNKVPFEASSHLKLFQAPATAVIVGTGTVGLEAITYASRILPVHSTIIILQNDISDPAKMENTLKTSIQGGENFQWLISSPLDLGRIDLIEDFLLGHQDYLAHAQLFIHTADKAKRYIPDRLDYQDVITQVIRRCSIATIDSLIERFSHVDNPYVRILFSSICSTNRDEYRLANIGPYQIGKIVGDELFKSATIRSHSYSFILYAGGMFTMGETITRKEEYQLLKHTEDSFKATSEKEYNDKWTGAGDHVDSMDSAGLMFKKIWHALQHNELSPGKLYSMYGSSVPKRLGHELNTFQLVEQAPYMFGILETTPEKS